MKKKNNLISTSINILVLGTRGSGKTTLVKRLSGKYTDVKDIVRSPRSMNAIKILSRIVILNTVVRKKRCKSPASLNVWDCQTIANVLKIKHLISKGDIVVFTFNIHREFPEKYFEAVLRLSNKIGISSKNIILIGSEVPSGLTQDTRIESISTHCQYIIRSDVPLNNFIPWKLRSNNDFKISVQALIYKIVIPLIKKKVLSTVNKLRSGIDYSGACTCNYFLYSNNKSPENQIVKKRK